MKCQHGRGAVCWLCSDKVPWWREARIKAGLDEEPISLTPAYEHARYNKQPPKQCRIPGCNSPHVARGLCDVHYHRGRRQLITAGLW